MNLAEGAMISYGNRSKLLHKLKQLSLIDIFGANKRQTYDELMSKLDLQDDNELENLFVSAKSASLITGKLDQRKREIYVEYVDGRDVSPNNLSNLIDTFTEWYVYYSPCYLRTPVIFVDYVGSLLLQSSGVKRLTK